MPAVVFPACDQGPNWLIGQCNTCVSGDLLRENPWTDLYLLSLYRHHRLLRCAPFGYGWHPWLLGVHFLGPIAKTNLRARRYGGPEDPGPLFSPDPISLIFLECGVRFHFRPSAVTSKPTSTEKPKPMRLLMIPSYPSRRFARLARTSSPHFFNPLATQAAVPSCNKAGNGRRPAIAMPRVADHASNPRLAALALDASASCGTASSCTAQTPLAAPLRLDTRLFQDANSRTCWEPVTVPACVMRQWIELSRKVGQLAVHRGCPRDPLCRKDGSIGRLFVAQQGQRAAVLRTKRLAETFMPDGAVRPNPAKRFSKPPCRAHPAGDRRNQSRAF